MSDSFEALKKNRGTSQLSEKLSGLTGGNKSFNDERFWKHEADKMGNYSGIIRFLPAPKGEDLPFVKVYNHGFKKNGKWFIENCPTTLGGECPVCEANGELWNSGIDSDKDIARDRKRKISYYANILVVKDPANPQNDGKHFLYRFGTKIMEKIEAASKGDPALGNEGIDIQDFWDGANLLLKVGKASGYVTYQDSQFQNQSELFDGNEDQLRELWDNLYSLQEFVDPSKFKTYDELSDKFNKFVNGRSRPSPSFSSNEESEEDTQPQKPTESPLRKAMASEESESAPFDTTETAPKKSALDQFRELSNKD